MAEEKEAQKQKQMRPWETQSWGLSNPEGKLSNIDPPPIIGTSSNNNNNNNNNDPLIAHHQNHLQVQVEVDNNNAEGDNKTTPLSRTSQGARTKRATGKTASGVEGKDGNGAGGGGEAADGHEMHIWTERERRKKMRNMFSDLHALLPQLPPKADKSSIVDEAVRYIKTLENTLEDLEKKKQERLKQAQLQSADSTTTVVYDPYVMNINSQGYSSAVSREAFMADSGGSSIHNSSTNDNNLASIITTNAINTIGTSSTSLSSLPSGIVPNNPVGFQTWSSSNVVVNICGDQAQFNVCSLKKPGLITSICTVFEKYKIEVLSAHISSDDRRCFYMIHAQANQFEKAISSAEETFRQAAGEMTLWLS